MFAYSDPHAGGILERHGALAVYREVLHEEYVRCARTRNSAFTLLDAFDGVQTARRDLVSWQAFPKLSHTSNPLTIDRDRFRRQDEYVEWHVVRSGEDVVEVVFTTAFDEYFGSLAARGVDALVDAVRELYPDADPSIVDLFGPGSDPTAAAGRERSARFKANRTANPWNNGQQGILCLGQQNNTRAALFQLLDDCATPNFTVQPSDLCSVSACEAGRNSDPAICQAIQTIARAGRSLSVADPAGVTIRGLGGIWELGGRQIDIEDQGANESLWTITQGGHRGILRPVAGLTVAGDEITSGGQIGKFLRIGATVISAPDTDLPTWARRGQESSRRIV